MPGKRHRFTLKEDELAKEISKEYEKKGYGKKRSKRIGYATVQRQKKRKGRKTLKRGHAPHFRSAFYGL